MKNIAKLLAVLLCVSLLTCAFASCNNEKKTTDDPSTGTSESTPAEEKGIWLPFVENK